MSTNQRPTPITDACKRILPTMEAGRKYWCPSKNMADLERELAEAREQRDRLVRCLDHLRETDWFKNPFFFDRRVICELNSEHVKEALAAVDRRGE
ncbi:MAG: hypothetical protein RL088_1035 [Verrucomicrobiota bacterium]